MKQLNSISKFGFFALMLCLLAYSCSPEDTSLTTLDDKSTIDNYVLGVDIPKPVISLSELRSIRKKVTNGKSISKELIDYKNALTQSFEDFPDFYPADYVQHMNIVLQAIDPDEYACDNADNALRPFILESDIQLQGLDYFYYFYYGSFPFYESIFFQTPSDPQRYGVNGEYTSELERVFSSLKRFWDIDGSDINMYSMNATVMQDEARLYRLFNFLYIAPDEVLREEARLVAENYQNATPEVQNNALFSFNAFAIRAPFLEDYRIVMGDGIMDAYASVGLGDIAPQGILAHEYAHQIQFENGYFEDEESPEATRRTELMADAYSAYYLKHIHGGAFRTFKVSEFLDVFFTIGDCGFNNDGHHGTYNQRSAAANWGVELAYRQGGRGRILPAHEFYRRFENSLDDIINCDACLNN